MSKLILRLSRIPFTRKLASSVSFCTAASNVCHRAISEAARAAVAFVCKFRKLNFTMYVLAASGGRFVYADGLNVLYIREIYMHGAESAISL
jgi:hypothetical protein